MRGKSSIWMLAGLAWLGAGIGIGLLLDYHQPAPPPPYAVERLHDAQRGPRLNQSDDTLVVCVTDVGGKMCFARSFSDEEAMQAAHARYVEDREVARAFWGVFTLAPSSFIFLVLWLIRRSGGMPGGFRTLEERNIPPRPR